MDCGSLLPLLKAVASHREGEGKGRGATFKVTLPLAESRVETRDTTPAIV